MGSLFADIEKEGFLYRSAEGHPKSGTPVAFMGLGVQRWVVCRKDNKTFTLCMRGGGTPRLAGQRL